MNYLVFLDAQAGELEKILSGLKKVVLNEFNPAQATVQPGDTLYFLRDNEEGVVRVKATVIRVLPSTADLNEDLSHILKELQPRLQLTEDQYNCWSTKKQAVFIEFEAAQKISEFHVAPGKIADRTRWILFEEIHEIEEEGVKDETSNNFTA